MVDSLPLVFVAPLTYVQHEPTECADSDAIDNGPDDEFSRSRDSDATEADNDLIDNDDDYDDNDNDNSGPGAP